MAPRWWSDFHTPPPTATVIPKAIATMLPSVTRAMTALTATLCFLVKDCRQLQRFRFFVHSFEVRQPGVCDGALSKSCMASTLQFGFFV
ncbi:hypothetical protein IFM46972_10711 [Aspergillus udagawae]|uniref:Uncharacterized protein n=1 Tax=Aspergillus udagawae TaxID=91492 RepID=A0A8H3XQR3_9EURO|nr:hypothetical protein IFM46972_10711 [Aspergillus udagawae]